MLKVEAISGTSRIAKFVGREAYEEKGGTVTADLFAQQSQTYFNDPEILNGLFAEKMEAEAEALRTSEGWAWAKVTDDHYPLPHEMKSEFGAEQTEPFDGVLSEEQAERYDELAELEEAEALDDEGKAELAELEKVLQPSYLPEQKALAGIMVFVNNSGQVSALRGLILPEQQAEAVEAEFLEPLTEAPSEATGNNSTQPEKSPFSQKFIDDMKAIRLAAVQTAMLDKPEYVLSLFAFYATPASGHYESIFGFGYGGAETNKPEIDDQFNLDPRIGGEHDEEAEKAYNQFQEMAGKGSVEAFKAFRDLGKKSRNGEITAFLARRFTTQRPDFMAEIAEDVGADIRSIWTPSAENCFKRLKGVQLDELYKDLLDLHMDTDDYRAFSKSKKGEKNEAMHKLFNDPEHQKALRVSPEQKARIDAWVPECF
jgi:ParB family chromosome partitioning protein